MEQKSRHPKVILLKGNGPITINSEMMELITITLSHGLIGLPLKELRAEKVCLVSSLESFWEIHKTIKDKPCCFIYCNEKLDEEDMKLIYAETISVA
jgi:hypothetical protein